jgi:hypothetical protein
MKPVLAFARLIFIAENISPRIYPWVKNAAMQQKGFIPLLR